MIDKKDLKHYQIAFFPDAGLRIKAYFQEGFVPLDRRDTTAVCLVPPIFWGEGSRVDRNWMFQLHSWRMLDVFLNRMEIDDLEFIGGVVSDWYQFQTSDSRGADWYWYDMATGLRASKLAWLLVWCYQQSADIPIASSVLTPVLKLHLQHLTNPSELSRGNHGLFQLNGLMALVDALEQVDYNGFDLKSARRFALSHMRKLLQSQLGKYGVHTENSPSYHCFIANKIQQVLQAPWWQEAELGDVHDLSRSAMLATQWLVTPMGACPPVGDSAEGSRLKNFKLLKEWKHQSDKESLGAQLDGYGVVRSRPKKPFDVSHYLLFQCSFHSASHKHSDCQSFVWQDAGDYWLWDAGKYGYQADEKRAYFLSTRAHNALEIDGEDYTRRGRDAYGSALRTVVPCDGGWLLEGRVYHHSIGILHWRVIFYQPGQGLDVLDLVSNQRRKRRTYRLWWQLGPKGEMSVSDDGLRLERPDGRFINGTFSASVGAPDIRHFFGDREPRMAGWSSPEYLQCQPSHSVACRWSSSARELEFCSSWRLDGAVNDAAFAVKDGRVQSPYPGVNERVAALVEDRWLEANLGKRRSLWSRVLGRLTRWLS